MLRYQRVLGAAALMLCAPAWAQDSRFEQERMTGNWGGARDGLEARGVDLSLGYLSEWLANTQGGTRRASAYADQITLGADVDLERAWGWTGGALQVRVSNRNGERLDDNAGLGTLVQTHELHGRGAYTRLSRLVLQQDLLDGRMTVKLGRGDVDFFPLPCNFINLSFCGALAGYHSQGWYGWPISQWFANATVRPTADSYLKLGVSEVNPDNLRGAQGLHLRTPRNGHTGTLSVLEAGWLPTLGGNRDGAYRLGLWHDSSRQVPLDPQAAAWLAGSTRGYYLTAEQQLNHNAHGGGLRLFANVTASDDRLNVVDQMLSLGLAYTAPFASRREDRIGVAIGSNRVGRHARYLQRLHAPGGGAIRDREMPFELNYRAAVAPGFALTPSVQYVRHPGAEPGARSAVVWGLRLAADL